MSSKQSRRSEAPYANSKMSRRTLFLLALCGVAAFSVLLFRLYDLQIKRHDEYKAAVIRQQIREDSLSAFRGSVYDSRGNVFAISSEVSNVFLSPAEISLYQENAHIIAEGLSQILGLDYVYLRDVMEKKDSWYEVIARKVEKNVSTQIAEFINNNNLKGVKLEDDTKRVYPFNELACHTIGFINYESNGVGGVEGQYNSVLKGISGRETNERLEQDNGIKVRHGDNISLTTDIEIQNIMEIQLSEAAKKYGAAGGAAAICMDVDTGAILGMVSLPYFNLNDTDALDAQTISGISLSGASEEEQKAMLLEAQLRQWENLAVSFDYEPGSIFKILTLSMALEEGLVDESTPMYCGGSMQVAGDEDVRNCWKKEGHGEQTLLHAVQQSCNVAFIELGLKLGAEKFYDYAEAFGLLSRTFDPSDNLSAKTGIDVSGESGSFWWSENTFCDPGNLSQLAAASFGQTFLITPIQLITAVSACCNGGRLMKPYVVEKITAPDGSVVSTTEPEEIRRVISEDTSNRICKILELVVSDMKDGTGKNAYVPGFRIGGKTGTTVNTVKEAGTGEKEYTVSFMGVAPIDDPKVALLVLFIDPDEASGVYVSGGQMAAPVVGSMLREILPHLGVEEKLSENETANMDKEVPGVLGLTTEEAAQALIAAGLSSRVIGDGDIITWQLPNSGNVIAAGTEIILYADAEPSADLEEMLDVTGMTYEIARQRLSYFGLYLSADSYVFDPAAQRIIFQSVPSGAMLEHGTVVSVTLSSSDANINGIY